MAQGLHAAFPVLPWKEPGVHTWQEVWPVKFVAVPATHGMHAWAAGAS